MIFEYKVTNTFGESYTLITSNDPSIYPDLVDIVTIGEYTPNMTQKDLVLA